MMKVFRDWFTGGDGETYDIGRWLWFLSVNSYIGLTVIQMYRVGGTIDFVAWGGGLAALLGAGGAALGLKANTEPKPSMSVTTMSETPTGSSATSVSVNSPPPPPPPAPVVVVPTVTTPTVGTPKPRRKKTPPTP